MEQLKQKQAEYLSLSKKLQDFIKTAPKEKLRSRKKGAHYQYYLEKNKKRTYIAKKNIETARKIAQRDYYQKLLPGLLKNLKTMEHFSKNYNTANLEQSYTNLSAARRQLVTPVFVDDETYATQWQAKNYERKKDTPDGSFITQKDEAVRSKSEIIIANILNSKKIPYHYEYPLQLSNGIIIYPDFFCLNKRTRQEFYWEHCGIMDDPTYTSTLTQRISDYSKSSIIPGKNLILTFETASLPLETKAVERLIQAYLI